MAVVRSFHRYRGEASFTMPQLMAILREQVPKIAPEQTRYRVTTIPTERTIRFYTARGLVDNPAGRDGQRVLYGYRHLLQILAIKCLQSHYLPLRKIRSLVENASNRELEQFIPEVHGASWAHQGLTRDDRRIPGERTAMPPPGRATETPSPPAPIPAQEMPPPAAPEGEHPGDLGAWHRLEVGPGIELHVHAAVLAADGRERLRGALLRELGVLRGWFDRAGKD